MLNPPETYADHKVRLCAILNARRLQFVSKLFLGAELAGVKEDSDRWQHRSVSRKFDARRHPRFPFEADIIVHTRMEGTTAGRTVDISESGISALLATVVPLGEVVELNFNLPIGLVTIHAAARQRTAFRYGFQFLQSDPAMEVIKRTCQQLAIEKTDERSEARHG